MTNKPDFNRLKKVLYRDGEPDVLPLFEYAMDSEIIRAITGKPANPENVAEMFFKLGYDYVPATVNIPYTFLTNAADDTSVLTTATGKRSFVNENEGIIENSDDFDAYLWPVVDGLVAAKVLQAEKCLPDGMKILIDLAPGGILETVMWLMGYVPFSYALYENEQLIWDLFERITGNILKAVKLSLEQPDIGNIGGVMLGDDMGFNHSTMISPVLLRKYVFPCQKQVADLVHQHDLPLIMHSCGKLDEIMDDLIDYVGIDAKHSFEDNIMPITEAKEKYGHRVALLGGIDMNFLCTAQGNEIRQYVDNVIKKCAPGGGFALGTGNSVANYIPLENYLTMIDECRVKGAYPIVLN